EVRLSVAGQRARVPGSINVATNARYGDSTWFGRILRDGAFEPSNRVETPAQLVPVLREFAEKPAEMAAKHGKVMSKCCFCDTTLHGEDGVSAALGYGPTCAKNFDLPWGKKAARAAGFNFECEEAA